MADVKVVSKVSMSGTNISVSPGDEIIVDQAEAERLIACGHCVEPENYRVAKQVIVIPKQKEPETKSETNSAVSPGTNTETVPSVPEDDDSEVGALTVPSDESEGEKRKPGRPKKN